MLANDGISVADALALRDSGSSNNNNDGWGGNSAWWIIIVILLFAFGGWGRNGNNDGGGGNNSAYNPCCSPATAQGMTDAFNFNQLDNGLRSLERGMCDGFYTTTSNINAVAAALQNCCCQTQQSISNATATLQQSIASLGYEVGQGFCGVDKAILQNSYQNQTGFNSLANQLSSCCCDLGRGQENLKYEVSQMMNSLLISGDKNTDRIINFLTQTEMDNIRRQNEEYRSQLQIANQTNNILNTLLPIPRPSYVVPSPFVSTWGCNFQSCNSCC